MRNGFRRGVVALALAGVGVAAAPRNPEPAESLASVRLVVTTKAGAAAITVGGATIASYIASVLGARLSNGSRAPSSRASRGTSCEFRPYFAGGAGLLGACSHFSDTLLDGPPAVSVSRTGRTLQLSGNVPGQPAEARFDIILADVAPDGMIAWNLRADRSADTQIELYSLNDLNRATLVDRFVSSETSAQFTSSSALLDSLGRIRVNPFLPRLVLAHYYPWYTSETWRDPQMAGPFDCTQPTLRRT